MFLLQNKSTRTGAEGRDYGDLKTYNNNTKKTKEPTKHTKKTISKVSEKEYIILENMSVVKENTEILDAHLLMTLFLKKADLELYEETLVLFMLCHWPAR